MSKGSKPRPCDKKEYDKNFNSIFGKWVSPLERKLKRIKELETDLTDCLNVVESLADDDPDKQKLESIITVIQSELDELQ